MHKAALTAIIKQHIAEPYAVSLYQQVVSSKKLQQMRPPRDHHGSTHAALSARVPGNDPETVTQKHFQLRNVSNIINSGNLHCKCRFQTS
jgi:hypothetical protein